MNKCIMIATVAASVALAGCQTTQEKMVESGAKQLTKSEVATFLTNKTVTWLNGNGASYYAPDGKMPFVFKGKKDNGSWSIAENGTICLKMEQFWGEKENCNWKYFKNGDAYSVFDIKKNKTTNLDLDKRAEGNTL